MCTSFLIAREGFNLARCLPKYGGIHDTNYETGCYFTSPALKSDTDSCHNDDHFVSVGVCFLYIHIGQFVIYTKPNLKRKKKKVEANLNDLLYSM